MTQSEPNLGQLRQEFDRFVPPAADLSDLLERIHHRRKGRFLLGAISIAVVAAALILPLTALLPLADRDAEPNAATSGLSVTVLRTDEIAMPDGVTDVALGYGSVWVPGMDVLTRLDPETGTTIASIHVPGRSDYRSVAIGEGAVWVTDSGRGALFRVDPGSNELVATIEVGGPALRVAAGGGYVWVTIPREGRGLLVKVDPTTDRLTDDQVTLGVGPGRVNFAGGYVWVEEASSTRSVMKIDPATGAVSAVVSDTFPEAVGDGAIWNAESGLVQRVDLATDRSEATIHVTRASEVAFGEGGAWVLSEAGSTSSSLYIPDPEQPATVRLIDPATDEVVGAPIAVGWTPGYLAVGLGSVWFGDFTDSVLIRVDVAVA